MNHPMYILSTSAVPRPGRFNWEHINSTLLNFDMFLWNEDSNTLFPVTTITDTLLVCVIKTQTNTVSENPVKCVYHFLRMSIVRVKRRRDKKTTMRFIVDYSIFHSKVTGKVDETSKTLTVYRRCGRRIVLCINYFYVRMEKYICIFYDYNMFIFYYEPYPFCYK